MSQNSFWDFEPWEKHDKIVEGRHDHLFYGALSDPQTGVEKVDRHTYIIYGKIEALLMKPTGVIYRMGIDLLDSFLSILHEKE